jgi:uroporphyrinogen-III decarboxylase
MDDTWVGAGLDPAHSRAVIKPFDVVGVVAVHAAGYKVSLHVCGRASLLLEDLADTGPDAIETLTSNRSSGDVDLADAKRRIGDRVCLFGGFNEHLLYETDAAGVREEVKRCMDAAKEGGGYVFRSTGQIFNSNPGLIEVMAETARELGVYR